MYIVEDHPVRLLYHHPKTALLMVNVFPSGVSV